MVFIAVCK